MNNKFGEYPLDMERKPHIRFGDQNCGMHKSKFYVRIFYAIAREHFLNAQ